MILRRLFGYKYDGFFVDVGAHHPFRFSNTHYFYELGWSGINIEPNPEGISLIQSARPRDICLQLGVSDCPGQLTYYQFDEPALNTFDYETVKAKVEENRYKLKSTCEVRVQRLDVILAEHLPENQKIDFLSIDVEGLDLSVLKSNNWEIYRPRFILIEMLNTSLEDVLRSEIYSFMKQQHYVLLAKTCNTLIFKNDKYSS